jgi:hypothetical protein
LAARRKGHTDDGRQQKNGAPHRRNVAWTSDGSAA